MARGLDMDDLPSSGNREHRKRPSDVIDIFALKSGKAVRLRPLPGGVFLYAGHWVKVRNKEGKETQFYAPCTAFDSETGKRAGGNGDGHCPWCEINIKYPGMARFSVDAYMNMMDVMAAKKMGEAPRPSQEERECKHKLKDSDTETPVRAVRLPMGAASELKKLKDQNRSGEEGEDGELEGEAFSVSDPEHGAVISIMRDDDAPPAKRYTISLAKRDHAIPTGWKKFLRWDLSELADPADEEEQRNEAKAYIKRNKDWLADKLGDGMEDDDEDEGSSKKSKSRRRDDDDEDDDEPPRKSKSRKSVEDDEDGDYDEPKSKSKSKKSSRDDDDLDDDDDDDEPPRKSKKKVVDDDDDDFDDSDDEDDEPPAKSKKKAPAKKSRKDDDDEDLDDDEDEDDDEPPRKSKASAKSKSRRRDDDDEDDDDL